MEVRNEPLQAADADGLKADAQGAFAFALRLLGAHAAANGRQRGRLLNDLISVLEIALRNLRDEIRNIHIHGAAANAGAVLAVQAPLRLLHRNLRCVAEGHLVKIARADFGVLRGHRMLLRIDSHTHTSPSA